MNKKINKSITFIYTGYGEYLVNLGVIEEAKNRGYKVSISDDLFAKDDIVFYCQHECFPKGNSKLSIVSLHDLGQMHGDLWPNPWIKENWNKFDIGFLPNKNWVNMWKASSSFYGARPRIGCYYGGWSKADIINDKDFLNESFKLVDELGFDRSKKTILYAPSWENDNKQLDFIESMQSLGVNMLIKQAPWNKDLYPVIAKNIEQAHAACKGLKNVYILDSKVNIFNAIAVSDILVSEESSTLIEAMLMSKPSIAVMDWLIPDVEPPRPPEVPFDFVIKTVKKDLSDCVLDILNNYEKYSAGLTEYVNENFPNVGHASQDIMDIIDSVIDGTDLYIEKKLPVSENKIKWSLRERLKWKIISTKAYLAAKYAKEDSNKFMHILYRIYKKCQHR